MLACLSSYGLQKKEMTNDELETKIEQLWQESKAKFYSPKSKLFYTRPLEKVPTPEQIKELYPPKKTGVPNWHGGGSGTEDCSMLGGIILAGLCDKYLVTSDKETIQRARDMFQGLKLAATAHGDKGFIARGVSPDDLKSIYPGTSRDQYTHSIHGMWRYYHSKMSTKEDKQDICQIFSDIAKKMKTEVKPDADPAYSFKFYNGMKDDRGTGKMLEVYPHEAARLSMFYAAAYDVTKKKEYFKLYREHLRYAIDRTYELEKMSPRAMRGLVPAYSVLQMNASLELLYVVEKDKKLKKEIGDVMDFVANFVETCEVFSLQKRDARDSAEVINGQLLSPNYKLSADHEAILRNKITFANSGYAGGAYTLLAAYWRARLEGYYPVK